MRFKAFLALMAVPFALNAADTIGPMPARFKADAKAVLEKAAGISAKDYPDADYVVVDTTSYTRYETNGCSTSWDEEWVVILTEKGRRDFSTVELSSNLRYGDAAILEIDIARDGKIEKVDFESTLKWATDNESMSSNIYDPQHKQLSCGVPGLKTGDVRHLVFARRMLKPRVKDAWGDIDVLEFTAPIISAKVAIDAPEALPPVHAVLRNPLGESVSRLPDERPEEGRILMRWEAANVPQAFEEPEMPPFYTQVQHLMLSTLPDWPTMSRWYWNLCLPHLEAVTDEIREKTASLVEDCPDDMSKIRAIYKFVAQEVRYMGLIAEEGAPGYEPHDVSLTFKNRYGVCRDKAALLAAMLREAGVEAYPVLIHAGAKLDPEVPVPAFNHAITAAVVDGQYVLMDPTDESSRDLMPAYLSDRSFLVACPEGDILRTSPLIPAIDNAFSAETRGILSEDGSIFVESVMRFTGINDNVYRQALLRMTEEERNRLFTRILTRFAGGAQLTGLSILPADMSDTECPLVITLKGRIPDLVIRGETRDVFTIPFFSDCMGAMTWILADSTHLETRRFPLHIDNTCQSDETVVIELCGALGEPLSLPKDENIGDGTGYNFTRTVSVVDGNLIARRTLGLSSVEFDPAAYGRLREDKKLVETALRAKPTFSKRVESNADTCLVSAETVTHIASAKAWTTTNKVVRSVSTYRGKKNSAELSYSYNTAVGDVSVLSAKVTAADGREFFLEDNEINIMDAGWVGAAPRYPATKLMVVTLPGVEIGSTIEFTTVTSVTNSPVDFAAEFVFDSYDPVKRKIAAVVAEGTDVRLKEAFSRRGDSCKGGSIAKEGLAVRDVMDVKTIAREPSQPPAMLWREAMFVTAADWARFAREFDSAYTSARKAARSETAKWAKAAVAGIGSDAAKIEAIRKALVRKVRLAGPSLYEVPFEKAFFPPDTTLGDSYGSQADRMNLLAAALEAVGFDVEVKLCSCDAKGWKSLTKLWREFPNPAQFSRIVLKVSKRDGFWPWSDRNVWYLGGENEYTPVNASAHIGDTCFDPAKCRFETIGAEEDGSNARLLETFSSSNISMSVRENGTVDVDFTSELSGAGVGAFRRKYEEMLPEDRSRHFQSLLGQIADNATATRELETDISGYPAKLSFSAMVPGMAVMDDDSITLTIPDFVDDLITVGGPGRKSPIAVSGADAERITYTISFPKGYTTVEHIPQEWSNWWGSLSVRTGKDVDGRLVVSVDRARVARDEATVSQASTYELYKAQNATACGRAGRTVIVRKSLGVSR